MFKMKSSKFLLTTIFVIGIVVITGCSTPTPEPTSDRFSPLPEAVTETGDSISTGSTGGGDVQIELTPHKTQEGTLSVDIAVNTHSVDLSQFDLTKITTLTFEGEELNPVSAPKLGGHHSSGTLVFEVDRNIESYTITITGIPSVQDRVFTW